MDILNQKKLYLVFKASVNSKLSEGKMANLL